MRGNEKGEGPVTIAVRSLKKLGKMEKTEGPGGPASWIRILGRDLGCGYAVLEQRGAP